MNGLESNIWHASTLRLRRAVHPEHSRRAQRERKISANCYPKNRRWLYVQCVNCGGFCRASQLNPVT